MMFRIILAGLSVFTLLLSAADTRLSFSTQPLSFEPNKGQSDSSAQFISRGAGYLVQLAPGHISLDLGAKQKVEIGFPGALPNAKLESDGLLPGTANYMTGADSRQWRVNIPTYRRVIEHAIYPGVNLAFYGNQNHLEYDFLIQPNASVETIRLRLTGADRTSLNGEGDLVIKAGAQEISFLKPVVYQIAGDGITRETIAGSYRLDEESGLLSFAIGEYDHSRELVIDPVLQYSRYVSTSMFGTALDKTGNTYLVTGFSYSTSTVTKLSPSGTVLYSTSFGTGLVPAGIAVDAAGRAYVAGRASFNATLPTSPASFSATAPPNSAAFLVQIAADGASIPYATYFAQSDDSATAATAVAVDTSGNAYLTGTTMSINFPTTPGAYQTTNPNAVATGFVSKFNTKLAGKASLIYSTLIGGNASMYFSPAASLNAIAIDGAGDAYVTGAFPSTYPVTSGAFQYDGYASASGGVYVTKFNATGTALVYSAYLGYGSGNAIALDGQNNAYVTGTVGYAGFPVTAGAYQTTYPGGFVVKLNAAGSTEIFSTFLGGPSSSADSSTVPSSIAVTPGCPATSPAVLNCNVYVAGYTATQDFPLVNPVQAKSASYQGSAFVVELANTGQSALFSTYLGGSSILSSPGPFLAVNATGTITLTGNLSINYSTSSFPVTVPVSADFYPAFLAKIAPTAAGEMLTTGLLHGLGGPVGVSSKTTGSTGQITIGNFGSSAIAISAIQVSPASFSQTSNCGNTLTPGGSCNMSIDFTPASSGNTTGKITITSNAGNSPQVINVTGIGYAEGYLQASVNSLAFPPQNLGTSSKTQTLTLTNLGSAASPLSFYFYGPDFADTTNCPVQLAAHASCTISVTSQPTQLGWRRDALNIIDTSSNRYVYIQVSGTGTLANLATSVVASPSAVQFAPVAAGSSSSSARPVYLRNTSAGPISFQSMSAAGDFQVSSLDCSIPGQLDPSATCEVDVTFSPTATGARTGTLSINNSASGTPLTVSLAGTGLASNEKLEIYPSTSVTVPDEALGFSGSDQVIAFQNTGTAAISFYRVTVSGDFKVSGDTCTGANLAGTNDVGTGVYSTCQVTVNFVPRALGSRTGKLTVMDSAPGSPHVVNLAGTGIAATGSLVISDNSLSFPAQAVGSTSGAWPAGGIQGVALYNPNDSPIQITAISVTGDFLLLPDVFCGAPPYTLAPGSTFCNASVAFSPKATGIRTGTLTVNSSAGTQTASLTGTGVPAANGSVQLIAGGSMDFGSLVAGQLGYPQVLFLYVGGSIPVTSNSYVISGPNASDFTLSGQYCGDYLCSQLVLQFTPSAAGARTATLTIKDSAGTQTLTLTGKGVTSLPAATTYPSYLTYWLQTQGSTSIWQSVTFNNNSSASIKLGNVLPTGSFLSLHTADTCSGQTIPAAGACSILVEYAPPVTNPAANALSLGTITFKNTSGTVLTTVPVSGYSLVPVSSARTNQDVIIFTHPAALGYTSPYPAYLELQNTGTTPLTVGAVGGTNIGVPGPSAEFSMTPGNYCSNQSIPPGSYCTVALSFTPNALGAATGTLSLPVTYANKTTATFIVKLNATGVAVKDAAALSPASLPFSDLAVGTSQTSLVTLTNTGNESLTVGALTGVNTIIGSVTAGEFSTNSNFGSTDFCSKASLSPGDSCGVSVTFTPSAMGARTGSIAFPVTYLDRHTASLSLAMSGNALSPVKQLQIYPQNVSFQDAVQNMPDVLIEQYISVNNIGNAPVSIGKDTISANAVDFQILSDTCASTVLPGAASCTVFLRFNPAATSTGVRTGVFSIGDNGIGGPHAVSLAGVALTAAQQIELSQSSINFGSQKDGTSSATQLIYVTNQTPTSVMFNSVVPGGSNAADFQISSSCYGYFTGSCSIYVAFAPKAGETGARTAIITETDSAPGSPRVITLTGIAVK